ncbi:MAG TPA: response regulator [Vicinamibacterales bacterium]|nr:response regulator [Vicinamibacterales bacterium]
MQRHVEPLDAGRARSSTVLIIEEPGVRDVYPEYLDFCGFKVLSASGAVEALHLAQAHRPDVILIDIARMAADTGWEAVRALKTLATTAAIPIVALINLASGQGSDEARAAGADVCLSKPCVPSQIARAIRAMLLWPRRERRSA